MNNSTVRELLIAQLEHVLTASEEAKEIITGDDVLRESNSVSQLSEILRQSQHYSYIFLGSFSTCAYTPSVIGEVQVNTSGACGRPSVVVNIEQVELLRSVGYTV